MKLDNGGTNKSATSGTGKNTKVLDEDHETLEVPLVLSIDGIQISLSFGKRLMQARNAKGITQKDLAQMINEKSGVINEYENGRAVPNPNIINKLEKALGTKLRDPKK